jgi:hypothetical protein
MYSFSIMDVKIQKRLNMIRRVEELFSTNQTLFANDLRFQELYGQLQTRSINMEQMLDEWQRLNIPLGRLKQEKQLEFEEKLGLLSDMLKYALQELGDTESLTQLRNNRRRLCKLSTIKKVEYAELILFIAEDNRSYLEKYAKGKTLLSEAINALEAFRAVAERPGMNRTENAIRKAYLYDEVYDLAKFIQGPLRVFMRTYQSDFPELFDQYMAFSKIGGSKVNRPKLSHDEAAEAMPSNLEETNEVSSVMGMSSSNGIWTAAPTGPLHNGSSTQIQSTSSGNAKKKAEQIRKALQLHKSRTSPTSRLLNEVMQT